MSAKWRMNVKSIDRSSSAKTKKLAPKGYANIEIKELKRQETSGADVIERLKVKKAWDMAMSPAKSIPMNAFMLYMSGNSIQIFSIMITVMLFINSISAILNSIQVFEQFSTKLSESVGISQKIQVVLNSNLLAPMALYIAIQGGNLGLGIWKMGGMGLLPTASSDWLAFLEPKQILEYATGNTF